MDVDNTVDLTPSRKVRDVAYAAAAAANSRQSMQRNINATTAAATLPSCSTVRECLDSLSRHVWDLDLRPMQLEVLLKLFSVENKMKKLEHWMHSIFDRAMSSVCKYNVEPMFLQLIAKLKWAVARDATSNELFPTFSL